MNSTELRTSHEAARLVCLECRRANRWLWSCEHATDWVPSGRVRRLAIYRLPNPYRDPDRLERGERARKDSPGRAEEPYTASVSMSIVARRWLETKDHRGYVRRLAGDTALCPRPGGAERAYLKERGFSIDGEPARKRRETSSSPDRTPEQGDAEGSGSRPSWWARVIHPRWRQHAAAPPDAREHLFQPARADRIQDEFRRWLRAVGALYAAGLRVGLEPRRRRRHEGPRFDPALLPSEARARWELDRALDRLAARQERYSEVLWDSVLAKTGDPGDPEGWNNSDMGWAPRVGVKRASKLLAIETARRHAESVVEAYTFKRTPIEQALDRLTPAIRRLGRYTRGDDAFLATLPQRIAAELAKRAPAAYSWLAEADEDGAGEVPEPVANAIGEVFRDRISGYGPDLDADLKAVIRNQAGDGQRILVALAASQRGFEAARKRERWNKKKCAPTSRQCWQQYLIPRLLAG
jgi:hypothetical protein